MRNVCCILLLLLCLPLPARGEAAWYVRVVARDDSPRAQAEKIQVRDAVLPLCPADPADLPASLPDISAAVNALAPGRADVRLWAPAGRPPRPTLYITLGPGEGHNWWGVLYDEALLMAAEDGEETDKDVTFIWPWFDWLLSLLGL